MLVDSVQGVCSVSADMPSASGVAMGAKSLSHRGLAVHSRYLRYDRIFWHPFCV